MEGGIILALVGMVTLPGYKPYYNDRFYMPADAPANQGYAASDRHFSQARMNPDILMIEAQHDMHIILPDHSADDRSKQTRRVYKANVDCGLRRSIILLFPILHRRTLTETARSGAPCGILRSPPPPQAHLADRSDR